MSRAISDGQLNQNRCLTDDLSNGPKVPVYDIRNCGPRHQFGANGKIVSNCNWQNFKRGSDIRKAIMAPEGYLLAAIDSAQIECRILNYLADQMDVIEAFAKGEDIYAKIATAFYARPISRRDVAERGTGKQLELSCGYGCGAQRFRATAKLGIYGPPVTLTIEQADAAVRLYRQTHGGVVGYWRQADTILASLAKGETTTWGPLAIKDRKIYLPNGAPLIYDTLESHIETEEGLAKRCYWRLLTRAGWVKMYGAKLVENVVQALARLVLSQAMIAIDKELSLPIVTCTHDEIVLLVKDDSRAQELVEACVAIMKRAPTWLPGIPLDAEFSLGKRYSK